MSPASQPERILIVRLSSLGDVIQTLPLPTVIRRSFPQAKIGWAIDSELAAAIEGHPDIDYIHPFVRDRWRRADLNPINWPRVARELRRFTDEIGATGYDLAIDAQGLLMSALIPFLAGIRRRIGFGHRRELSHLFYTEKYLSRSEYFAPDRPHTEQMLVLARAIGCKTGGHGIHLPEVAPCHRHSVASALERAFGNRAPLIAIAPGSQWPSKQWPAEHWLELIERILGETAANLVVIGSKSDAPLAARLTGPFVGRGRVLDFAGKTTVPELYALLGRAAVTIAPDTAPLHAAGAAQCSCLIGIYGPTPTVRTGPSGSPNITLLQAEPPLHCQPCRQRVCRYATNQCMRQVSPAGVFVTVAQALDDHC
jgi:lipopolysaccharide heptosyltransferase I